MTMTMTLAMAMAMTMAMTRCELGEVVFRLPVGLAPCLVYGKPGAPVLLSWMGVKGRRRRGGWEGLCVAGQCSAVQCSVHRRAAQCSVVQCRAGQSARYAANSRERGSVGRGEGGERVKNGRHRQNNCSNCHNCHGCYDCCNCCNSSTSDWPSTSEQNRAKQSRTEAKEQR